MKIYLRDNNSDNLILFFCGWGMDENPFSILKSDYDILFVYDYVTPDFPEFDFSKYKSVKLLSFSYGVYAGAIADLPNNLKIDTRVAINGTLIPVDDKLGVPVRQFELTEKMDSDSVVKFRQRLFGGEQAHNHFEIFEKHLPKRTAKSCTDELLGMKKYTPQIPAKQRTFDKIYIGLFDRCVPTRNQMNFWKKDNNSNIIELNTGHFPFYNYEKLEELL